MTLTPVRAPLVRDRCRPRTHQRAHAMETSRASLPAIPSDASAGACVQPRNPDTPELGVDDRERQQHQGGTVAPDQPRTDAPADARPHGFVRRPLATLPLASAPHDTLAATRTRTHKCAGRTPEQRAGNGTTMFAPVPMACVTDILRARPQTPGRGGRSRLRHRGSVPPVADHNVHVGASTLPKGTRRVVRQALRRR
jgi:hypothetical protein